MSVRVFFIAVGACTFLNCKCEDTVRRAIDQKRPEPPVVSEPDPTSAEVEPNDAPENSSTIVLGHELRSLHADVASPGDIDWFSIQSGISADEIIELRVVPQESGLNLSLHIQSGAESSPPSTYDVGHAGDAEVVAALRIGSKPVRFAVRSVGSQSGAYTIEASRQLGDGLEAEPNDSAVAAQTLEIPSRIQGLIDRPDDRDVFVLKSDVDRFIRFAYEPVQGVTQVVRMFDSDRLVDALTSMQFGGARGERGGIPAIKLTANQPLWLVVTTTGGFDRRVPYTIDVSEHTELSKIVEFEPNDRLPRSVDVPGQVQGGFYAPEDIDRFMLGQAAEPTLVPQVGADTGVRLGHQPDATADSDAGGYAFATKVRKDSPLRVHVEKLREGDVVGVTINDGDGERTQVLDASRPEIDICQNTYRPGEVELVLRPVQLVDKMGLSYNFSMELLSGDDLEIEPNDSIADADELASERRGLFKERDTDVYGFRVPLGLGPKHVVIELQDASPSAVMSLVDETGAIIAKSDTSKRIEVDLPTGTYFVQLSGDGSCTPYLIKLVQ